MLLTAWKLAGPVIPRRTRRCLTAVCFTMIENRLLRFDGLRPRGKVVECQPPLGKGMKMSANEALVLHAIHGSENISQFNPNTALHAHEHGIDRTDISRWKWPR